MYRPRLLETEKVQKTGPSWQNLNSMQPPVISLPPLPKEKKEKKQRTRVFLPAWFVSAAATAKAVAAATDQDHHVL